MDTLIALLGALAGAATAATAVMSVLLVQRGKVRSEGHKTDAEARATEADTVMKLLDELRENTLATVAQVRNGHGAANLREDLDEAKTDAKDAAADSHRAAEAAMRLEATVAGMAGDLREVRSAQAEDRKAHRELVSSNRAAHEQFFAHIRAAERGEST